VTNNHPLRFIQVYAMRGKSAAPRLAICETKTSVGSAAVNDQKYDVDTRHECHESHSWCSVLGISASCAETAAGPGIMLIRREGCIGGLLRQGRLLLLLLWCNIIAVCTGGPAETSPRKFSSIRCIAVGALMPLRLNCRRRKFP